MECVVCVWIGVGWGEWVTGLGLGFTNSGWTWEKWGLCFGCDGEGGVVLCLCVL